jgi:tetratricopeptide (TPR) repeat protein
VRAVLSANAVVLLAGVGLGAYEAVETTGHAPSLSIEYGDSIDALVGHGEHQRALSALESALRLDARSNRRSILLSRLGAVASVLGRPEEAIEHLREAVAIDPDAHNARRRLLVELEAMERWEDAIPHYPILLQADPQDAQLRIHHGFALQRTERLDEAVRSYERALVDDPTQATAHYNLGTVRFALGDPQGAIRAYERTVDLSPGSAAVHVELGRAHELAGSIESAIDAYEKAVAIAPDFAEARARLALALLAQGRFELALQEFASAVARSPDSVLALNNLAWLLATHPLRSPERTEQAIAVAERAATLTDRRDAGVLDTLATAYASAGRFEAAVRTLDEAIDISSGRPALVADLGTRLARYRMEQSPPASWTTPEIGADPRGSDD